jgi:hypothetical protein
MCSAANSSGDKPVHNHHGPHSPSVFGNELHPEPERPLFAVAGCPVDAGATSAVSFGGTGQQVPGTQSKTACWICGKMPPPKMVVARGRDSVELYLVLPSSLGRKFSVCQQLWLLAPCSRASPRKSRANRRTRRATYRQPSSYQSRGMRIVGDLFSRASAGA